MSGTMSAVPKMWEIRDWVAIRVVNVALWMIRVTNPCQDRTLAARLRDFAEEYDA